MRSSAQKMQRMLLSDGAHEVGSSSPLARKSRQSNVTAAGSFLEQSPRSARLFQSAVPDNEDDEDELSPSANKTARIEEEQAEEVNDAEAARVLGRKRPRRSAARRSSPLLGSQEQAEGSQSAGSVVKGHVEEHESEVEEEPPPKRQRKKPQPSPAKQKQPAKKPRAPRRKKEKGAAPRRGDTSADEMAHDDTAVIPITVQRFKKPRKRQSDGADADILAADIPYINQKGVNVVDVLAQSSEEVIGTCIEQLANSLQNAEQSSARKELRVKIKALEGFGEEVRTRLLTHVSLATRGY